MYGDAAARPKGPPGLRKVLTVRLRISASRFFRSQEVPLRPIRLRFAYILYHIFLKFAYFTSKFPSFIIYLFF